MKIGFGYDSHRFQPGRPLILGGVRIEHDRGLAGHSDADALLHAITDAILGGVGAGDLGELFPDSDPRWKDADSATFVAEAMKRAAEKGYAVANCDVTILTEQPKLLPYKPAIRANVAALLGVDAGAVSIKAKTNEGMGFVGRGEGLAVMAVVLLVEA